MKNTVSSKRRSKHSRALNRAIILTVLLIAAGLIAFLIRASQKPPAIKPAPVVLRKAAPAWGNASKRELQQVINSSLGPAVAASYAWSAVVLSQDGSQLYADRALTAVVPASTQKLVVADAALASFGPHYRFHTLFVAAKPPQDGTLAGNLWLVGSGDPSLRSSDLQRGVQKLHAQGLQRVDGGVCVDASAFMGPELNPHWNPADANEDFMAAISAVSIDEDTVEFRLLGTSSGATANVWTRPQSAVVRYYGSVRTSDADDVIVAATGTPNLFRLAGDIPPGVREIFYLPVHGIASYAGDLLTRFFRVAGIAVARPPSIGHAPVQAQTLWDHPSPEMTQLIHHMLIFSDNHFAEQFLRALGGLSRTASDAGGLAAEIHVLRSQGVPLGGLHLVDGSGLAPDDRVAAMTLARILAHADANPQGNLLYPLLARGGLDGTLRWYHFAQARGRVRAKSGHLASVSSLAGYIDTRRHGRVVFAFLFNGAPDVADRAIVNAVDQIAQR